jgi:hypothetical protein
MPFTKGRPPTAVEFDELADPPPTRRFPIKKTNAAAISRLLHRNDFIGTATNSGKVVDVHFRETPLMVNKVAAYGDRWIPMNKEEFDSHLAELAGRDD